MAAFCHSTLDMTQSDDHRDRQSKPRLPRVRLQNKQHLLGKITDGATPTGEACGHFAGTNFLLKWTSVTEAATCRAKRTTVR